MHMHMQGACACTHTASLPQDIFRREKLEKLADGLRPYTVQSTSSQTGLVEAMTDGHSVDSVKRRMLKASKPTSLEYYYRQRFDPLPTTEGAVPAGGVPSEGGASAEETGNATFEEAQWMCMYSVAAYSLVQYILALKARNACAMHVQCMRNACAMHGVCLMCARYVRRQRTLHPTLAPYTLHLTPHTLALQDRHNGNILVDSRGRMVHLGFSYVLGWAPGGMTFEKTAFKLTRDVVDVWGGRGSPIYDEFTNVMVQGMHAVQSHHRSIMRNVELMVASGVKFPCLTSQYTALHRAHIAAGSTQLSQLAQRSANNRVLSQLRHRFRLYKSKHKLRRYTLMLIDYAYENFWTTTYAKFQLLTNGIVP